MKLLNPHSNRFLPVAVTLAAGLCLGLALGQPGRPLAAAPGDPGAQLAPIDPAALGAILSALPPAPAPESLRSTPSRDLPPQPLQQPTTLLLEDFERTGWPVGPANSPEAVWLPSTLTDLWAGPGGGYRWTQSRCQASSGGLQSLCPICGGPEAGGYTCGAAYPERTASSIVLRLDLSRQRDLAALELRLDVWSDAEPHEGLIINYLETPVGGGAVTRRPLRSFSGVVRSWAPEQRVNLLDARDEEDPAWRGNLSGQVVDLEFLFISHSNPAGGVNGAGIFIDNLRLRAQPRTVIITATRTPTPRVTVTPTATQRPGPTATQPTGVIYCPEGEPCGRLRVEVFVDTRCDGRYQAGVDMWLGGQRIDVDSGGVLLGTDTARTGGAYFLLPALRSSTIRYNTLPAGYQLCPNSPNPIQLSPGDFGLWGNKQVNFRVRRAR